MKLHGTAKVWGKTYVGREVVCGRRVIKGVSGIWAGNVASRWEVTLKEGFQREICRCGYNLFKETNQHNRHHHNASDPHGAP